jgi:choline dehydrogenase
MSVIDANLKVYGIEKLRIADGSIMPRVTTGNTMAPCVIYRRAYRRGPTDRT